MATQILHFFLVPLFTIFLVHDLATCEVQDSQNNAAKFVRAHRSGFSIDDSPFLFSGFNAYWLTRVAAKPTERYKVSQVFRDAAVAGLTVCRTWAFGDGGEEALQVSPGNYNESVFQGLDFVISEAKKYKIRLILSLVNNFNDFGGRSQYVQWAKNVGASITHGDDDFYTHPVVRGYYKNHIEKVLTRFNTITRMIYKDDPTIMAWELINEPRCQIDYSGRIINEWVQEMATYVKALDKIHLLEIGLEGFYGDTMPEKKKYNPGYQIGTDFISNNLIKQIDFATIHAYPAQWLPGKDESTQMKFMQRWISSHWKDSKNILKKPLVLSEFGKSSKDSEFTLNSRNEYMRSVYRLIYGLARNGGTMSGSLIWQLMGQDMDSYDDGFSIVLGQNPSTTRIISSQANDMAALAKNHIQHKYNSHLQQSSFVHIQSLRNKLDDV